MLTENQLTKHPEVSWWCHWAHVIRGDAGVGAAVVQRGRWDTEGHFPCLTEQNIKQLGGKMYKL